VAEKKAEEEHLRAKKAKAATTQDIVAVVTISPPADTDPLLEEDLTNELYAMTVDELTKHRIETYGFSKVEADLYVAYIKKKRQAMEKVEQQALCLDSAEAKEHLAHHGMQPNHLFGGD
jgi:hypothetical protein